MSKRLLLAKSMQAFGITPALHWCRSKRGILIINHHRIGDPNRSRFDRGVFSATEEQLDRQVRYLRKHFAIVGGEEMEHLVTAEKPLNRLYVAITFDDGYLDNYKTAFNVLRSNNCTGFFFLVPEYVGTATIPWWDAIAYLVRNSQKPVLSLTFPAPFTVHLEADREPAIHAVLRHFKRPDNTSPDEFLQQLRSATGCDLPDTGRRFLNWTEASEMKAAGMTIGSHTYTHRILSSLSREEQQQELSRSKSALESNLSCEISTLAYPVGSPAAFTTTTEELAISAGYKLCFSFYGGLNAESAIRKTNVLRMSVDPDHRIFRNQMIFMTRFGRIPY